MTCTNKNDIFLIFFLYSENNIWQIAAVKKKDIIACRNSQKTSNMENKRMFEENYNYDVSAIFLTKFLYGAI